MTEKPKYMNDADWLREIAKNVEKNGKTETAETLRNAAEEIDYLNKVSIDQNIEIARLQKALTQYEPDNCEVCHGKRGGVKGNENVIDGKIMCDYCTADYDKQKEKQI